MRITFQNPTEHNMEAVEQDRYCRREKAACNSGKSVNACDFRLTSAVDKSRTMGEKARRDKGTTLAELQQKAENADVAVSQDYMTLMSNTMSQEDYARFQEEGFRFEDMEPEMAVTIVDKIKAELARSGQYITGYNDDLDVEALSAAVGSETLARAITDSFKQADIPLTQDNIGQVMQAWDMACKLDTPTDGGYHYMVDNELEPELWNFYLAQSSGAREGEYSQPGYYAEEVSGYYSQSAPGAFGVTGGVPDKEDERLVAQIDRVIEQAGLSVDEESRQTADWLLEQDLPLTPENLLRLKELKGVSFPVKEETLAKAAATALVEGKSPLQGNLAQKENIYERAAAALAHYDKLYQEQTEGNFDGSGEELEQLAQNGRIAERRQLEEIRLRMTAEVNVKLLKSGFSIDTAPMEELVEALKQAEAAVAEQYFPGDEQAVAKYESYTETTRVMEQLPMMPAQLLGSVPVQGADAVTLSEFHAEGTKLRTTFEKAQESYEALMTAPRRDMGDSMKKAFANVDDILGDLGYEASEENRRAVRILGYNRMEMNAENIELVKAADEQVQSVIEKMTPAATLKMIRDGINPLEKSFDELNQYFDGQPESYEEAAESYSRFLYGMEQRGDITEEERESFIGIYRLIRQIEKGDGAAIGVLVNSQAQLHFSNLLSAVRSGRYKGLDVRVTEELGAVEELIRKGESISEQIAKGFAASAKSILTEMSYSEMSAAAYSQLDLEQLRATGQAGEDSLTLLQRGELPVNAGNLLAAQALVADAASPFGAWKQRVEENATQASHSDEGLWNDDEAVKNDSTVTVLEERLTRAWESLDTGEAFTEEYGAIVEEAARSIEAMSLTQGQTSMDVRGMQLLHKQLSVVGALARSQEYILPMYIGDELSKVHLTLKRGGEDKGSVDIEVDLSENEHIEAHFQLSGERLSGFLVGNTASEVKKLREAADIFIDSLKEDSLQGYEVGELPIVSKGQAAAFPKVLQTTDGEKEAGTPGNIQLYRAAKVFLRAVQQQKMR